MKKIIYFLPSITIMVLIFLASNDPASGEKSDFITKFIFKILDEILNTQHTYSQEMGLSFFIRKMAHITEYALLSLSIYFGLSKNYNINNEKNIIMSSLFSIFYAITDEYHQTFIVGRVGTYEDVLIDSIGILIISLALNKIILKKKKKS